MNWRSHFGVEDTPMDSDIKSRRYSERRKTSIPGIVRWWDVENCPHEETIGFVDVSRLGVRFSLSASLETGQPILMIFAMPPALRAYDRKEHDYSVWGVVRSSLPEIGENGGSGRCQIGVALTGGNEPQGYSRNRATRYDLKPFPSKDGFWQVRELPAAKPG